MAPRLRDPSKPRKSGNTTIRKQKDALRAAGQKIKHPAVSRLRSPGSSKGPASVQIDPVSLYEAAKTHASYEQLGLIYGVSANLLSETPEFRELILKARAEQQKNLLSAQFATAITDRNPTMQIWLGKQYLGQKDINRQERTGADGAPLEGPKTVIQVQARMPSNGRDD